MNQGPIRVLHFVASSSGGGATYAKDLVEGLADAGFHNTLLMPADQGQVSPEEIKQTIVWNGGFPQLRTLISACHIVNCHGARAAFWARLACLGLGEKRPAVVYTIHGFMVPHYPMHKRLAFGAVELLLKTRVDRCIAVSTAEKLMWCQYGLATDEQVDVIPYGLDSSSSAYPKKDRASTRKELGLDVDDVVMTQVARFYWPRDFSTLLRAFDAAAEEVHNLQLLLVGDGPWYKQVEQKIAELKHRDRIIMAGMRRDIMDIFHASDIAVLSSAGGDGFPIVNLEAMQCKLPVISAQCDGIPEQVTPGDNGLLYPVGDVGVLRDHIITLGQDAAMRSRMGAKGADLVSNVFTRSTMLESTAASFRRVLKEST